MLFGNQLWVLLEGGVKEASLRLSHIGSTMGWQSYSAVFLFGYD